MKIAIIALGLLCLVYPIGTNAQVPCPLIDQDTFNNPAAWTSVDNITGNGSIQVTAGSISFSNTESGTTTCTTNHGACNGREMRLWRPLSQILSNTAWRAESKFRITDGNGVGHTLMGFTAGSNEPQGNQASCPTWTCNSSGNLCASYSDTNQDGIFASIIAFGGNQIPLTYKDQIFTSANQTHNPPSAVNPSNLGWRIFGHAKNNADPFYRNPVIAASNTLSPPVDYSRGIALPALGTDYYLRLERLSASSCMISVFSDPLMQTHIPGSPQCFLINPEIGDLNTVQNFVHQSGSFYRSITGTLDDLKVFNPCPNPLAPCDLAPSPTPTATPTPSPTPTPSATPQHPSPTPTPSPTPGCGVIGKRQATCDHGIFTYTFTVTNNSPQTIQYLLLSPKVGGTFTITPNIIYLSTPLNTGQSTSVTVTIGNANPGDNICINVTLADKNVRPCCTIQTCVDLPECPCLRVLDTSLACGPNGTYTYTVSLQNLTGVPVHQIFIVPTPANVNISPQLVTLSTPLQQNQTTTLTITITNTGAPPATNVCLRFSPLGKNAATCCSTEKCFPMQCVPVDTTKPNARAGKK